MKFLRPMPMPSNSIGAWIFAAGAFLIVLAIRFLLAEVAGTGSPYLIFIPAIILTTYFAGLWPAIASGIASTLAARYFFASPQYSFTLTSENSLSFGLFIAVVAIDIAIVTIMRMALDQLDAERRKSTALAEQREVLFRELQHRISNNLAIVSALLNLERADVEDEKAKQALTEAATRLALIGKIHRRLHDPAGAQLRFGPFVEDLCRDVLEASGAQNIVCLVSAAEAVIPEEKLVPLALIVTELISNALEHGFAGRQNGTIRIDLTSEGTDNVLTVADDGNGLPPDFSLEPRGSMGLRIVQSLTQQIGGSFAMEGGRGTTCRLVFQASSLATA
jgi:two-component system, sensor histidine kinase PdtaS